MNIIIKGKFMTAPTRRRPSRAEQRAIKKRRDRNIQAWRAFAKAVLANT